MNAFAGRESCTVSHIIILFSKTLEYTNLLLTLWLSEQADLSPVVVKPALKWRRLTRHEACTLRAARAHRRS